MDISANIKAIRSSIGVSQAELSRRLDLDPSAYNRIENRGDKLSIEQLKAIAQALNVTLIDVLTWGENKTGLQTDTGLLSQIEYLQGRVNELEEEVQRAHRITDAFVYMLNSGEVKDKARGEMAIKNHEKDLDEVYQDSSKRLGVEGQ